MLLRKAIYVTNVGEITPHLSQEFQLYGMWRVMGQEGQSVAELLLPTRRSLLHYIIPGL